MGKCESVGDFEILDVSVDNQSGNHIVDAVIQLKMKSLSINKVIKGKLINCNENGLLVSAKGFNVWVEKKNMFKGTK